MSPTEQQRARTLRVRVRRGIPFAEPAGRPLLLDLYLPDTPEPAPLVVLVHGGGWAVGDRASFGPAFAGWSPTVFEQVAAAGFAVASVDYRLTDEAVFPAQLDDVRAALRWLREQAAELGLDGSRTVVWGESAGGHLAALAGLTPADAGPVAGVVAWYPPTDLTTMAGQAGPDSLNDPEAPDSRESRLLGGPPAQRHDLARAASPVTHVHPGSPPFLLAHGTRDRLVPFAQSEQLADALRDAGADVELHAYDAGHVWDGLADARPVLDQALRFLERVTT